MHDEDIPKHVGPYTILREIGGGGSARIYLGRSPRGQYVAVKVMRPTYSAHRERAIREARILKGVHSPYIIKYLDEGWSVEGQFYIVMEYLPESRDLRECVQGIRVSWQDACEIIVQICRALAHAHSRGIVHRDLKPENILVYFQRGSLRIKIIDFGLAISTFQIPGERLTPTDYLVGTPEFMAPEIIQYPSAIRTATDVHAIVLIFYRLLTGKDFYPYSVPEEAASRYVARRKRASSCPTYPTHPDIPVRIWNLMRKGFTDRPEDRPADARAFLHLLEHALRRTNRREHGKKCLPSLPRQPNSEKHFSSPEQQKQLTPDRDEAPGSHPLLLFLARTFLIFAIGLTLFYILSPSP